MGAGSVPSLDGRVFAVRDSGSGVATTETVFRYAERGLDREPPLDTELELLADGRVRLNETWEWESRPGSGRSVAEEVR